MNRRPIRRRRQRRRRRLHRLSARMWHLRQVAFIQAF